MILFTKTKKTEIMNVRKTLQEINEDIVYEMKSNSESIFSSNKIPSEIPLVYLWTIKDTVPILWDTGIPKNIKSKLEDILEEFNRTDNRLVANVLLPKGKEYLKTRILDVFRRTHSSLNKKRLSTAHLYYYWNWGEQLLLTRMKELNISNEDIELFLKESDGNL